MASAQLVEADYISAQYLHGRPGVFGSIAFGVVAALLGAVAVWALQQGVSVLAAGILGGAIGLSVVRLLVVPWQAKRIFRQQKNLHMPYFIEWDEQGVLLRNEAGEVRTPWGHFTKWKENKRLFLLYHSDVLFQLVPKSAFTGGEESSFRRMLIEGMKES